ncbi:MAG: SUKH-3 domain-containing protein [Gemmataceae bacterium]
MITRLRLFLAGWRSKRDVWAKLRLPTSPMAFPEAKRILSKFGGLRFGNSSEHIVFEPADALAYDPDLIRRCEAMVGRRLYPIGYQEHQEREPILVDESGSIYINFDDELFRLADSFEEVLSDVARACLAPKKRVGATPKWLVGGRGAS